MQRESSSRIAVLLLDTLRKLECESDASRDDPAVASLERYVVRLVGELDAIKGDHVSAMPAPPPSPSLKILEILRNTLIQIKQMSDTHSDIGNLKDNLIHAIAELELTQSAIPAHENFDRAGAVPRRSLSDGQCHDGPLSGETASPRPPEQVLSEERMKNRSSPPEFTGDRRAPGSGSGGTC